ncbi:MAG: hypothetical protein HY482_00610 [Candidatus Wildermuthbacteria bacterium]|nr:hypothetical protein [Candidatus Wildermuthbacteria bacterium]
MILGFLDWYTVFVIMHLIGVTLGAGGAFVSDVMFFASVKDKKISYSELRFLKLGGKVVIVGLCVLVVSGVLLFSLDPARYMESSKFLAKMTIVAVLILNGVLFHAVHMPMLNRLEANPLPTSAEFFKKSSLFVASGAISLVSWLFALSLGAISSIPYPYWMIMAVYAACAAGAVAGVIMLKKRWFFLTKR